MMEQKRSWIGLAARGYPFYVMIFAKLFSRKVNVDKNAAGNELSARL